MIRRETKRHTAVYNIFSQSQCQIDGSFLRFFITQRIIIQRTRHTGHGWIITVTILIADYFLQNNGHFFLIDHIRCSLHIGFTIPKINGSINAFDCIGKHTQHLIPIVQIRNHISVIDSGKRLIVRIFQQRRRTDSNRRFHHIKESKEVLYQSVRQFCFQEISQYRIIIRIRKRNLIQIVNVHKFIEYVRTKHHCLRNGNTGILKLFKFGITFHHIIYKSQTASLSSQRTVTDTGKVGITVETVTFKDGNHSLILHFTVFHNRFKDNPAMRIHVLKAAPCNRFQKLCHREHGA